MGRITVRDLLETSDSDDEVLIADYNLAQAQTLVDSFRALGRPFRPKLGAVFCDARNPDSLKGALHGAFAVISAAQHTFNLDIMRAALHVRAHYVDLGGLFHMTRKQLELDADFKAVGRTALLGMGAAPGITNILSRYCADQLDTVTEIHTRVGSVDQSRYEPKPALSLSYSLKTILEEFSTEPAVFTRGEFKFVQPMSGDAPHPFPKPVGTQRPMYTIHSEVATLPLTYRDKGVKEVSFKIAFDPEFVSKVRFLRDLGFGRHEPITLAGVPVVPVDVANYLGMNQPPSKLIGKLKQYEVVRAVVKGVLKKKKVTLIADCHTQGIPEWGLGLDVDTGCPPAIAAQMLKLGEVSEKGVLAPEVGVTPKPFFAHLKKRKMKVVLTKKAGWKFPT
jgi:lysine 6-dehydrogenase